MVAGEWKENREDPTVFANELGVDDKGKEGLSNDSLGLEP